MPTGSVKWFDDSKGFGFITQDDSGEEVFVHHPSIIGSGYRTLTAGQRVEYEVIQDPKGLRAANVRPIHQESNNAASQDNPRLVTQQVIQQIKIFEAPYGASHTLQGQVNKWAQKEQAHIISTSTATRNGLGGQWVVLTVTYETQQTSQDFSPVSSSGCALIMLFFLALSVMISIRL